MDGFLFHDVIFGPVRSRRLGLSLGINLLPNHMKYCSFNCIYCECGFTPMKKEEEVELPPAVLVAEYLEKYLADLSVTDYLPDAITFAGNGEPTLHPEFGPIVEDTIRLRDQYSPESKVSILSNASMIYKPDVFRALQKLDNNIQKLDAGSDELFQLINNPVRPVRLDEITGHLRRFNGNVIIQSMFLRGTFRGRPVDNTTEKAVSEWIDRLLEIHPRMVMIYPIARATPLRGLEKVPVPELEGIAEKIRAAGLYVGVYH
jgi:wyosine [tRNA(Phe)-imidazoG37] synthetase (radical SAM superfamily)